MKPKAILIDTKDNVATAFQDLSKGDSVTVALEGREATTTLAQDIPFGHKFALAPIGLHQPVVKYGEAIGLATDSIGAGQHVHVHNMESQKGRGDK
jgi:altronate dehydratase small subunit